MNGSSACNKQESVSRHCCDCQRRRADGSNAVQQQARIDTRSGSRACYSAIRYGRGKQLLASLWLLVAAWPLEQVSESTHLYQPATVILPGAYSSHLSLPLPPVVRELPLPDKSKGILYTTNSEARMTGAESVMCEVSHTLYATSRRSAALQAFITAKQRVKSLALPRANADRCSQDATAQHAARLEPRG